MAAGELHRQLNGDLQELQRLSGGDPQQKQGIGIGRPLRSRLVAGSAQSVRINAHQQHGDGLKGIRGQAGRIVDGWGSPPGHPILFRPDGAQGPAGGPYTRQGDQDAKDRS